MGAVAGAQRLKAALGRQLPYLGPVLGWLGVIGVLSTDAGSSPRTTDPIILAAHRLLFGGREPSPAEVELLSEVMRKSAHVLEYAVLGLLLCRWLRFSWKTSRFVLASAAVAIAISCAMVDESHQALVPSRSAALRDVCYDGSGAILGVLAITLWFARESSWKAESG